MSLVEMLRELDPISVALLTFAVHGLVICAVLGIFWLVEKLREMRR